MRHRALAWLLRWLPPQPPSAAPTAPSAARCPLAAAVCVSAPWHWCWQPPHTLGWRAALPTPHRTHAAQDISTPAAGSSSERHIFRSLRMGRPVARGRGAGFCLQRFLGPFQVGAQLVDFAPQQAVLRTAPRDFVRLLRVLLDIPTHRAP